MPDFQRLTKLIVKHALGYRDVTPSALKSRFRQSDGRGRPSHIVARASPPALEPPKRPATPGKLNLNGLKRGVGLLAGLVSCAHQATPAKSSACTLNCKSYSFR